MFEEQVNVEMERAWSRMVVSTLCVEKQEVLLGLLELLEEEKFSAFIPTSLRAAPIPSVLFVRLPSKISFGGRKRSRKSNKKNCYGMYSQACFSFLTLRDYKRLRYN